MGFFGKGTLSRSEPSWLEREKARLRAEGRSGEGGRAAEDATTARREERKLFKLERALAEREGIERQRLIEQGELVPSQNEDEDVAQVDEASDAIKNAANVEVGQIESTEVQSPEASSQLTEQRDSDQVHGHLNGPINATTPVKAPPKPVSDQEHLQLTLEEAFFLHYALGVLTIIPPRSDDSPPLSPKSAPATFDTIDILELFGQHSTFPPPTTGPVINADDQFLLNYVTYHHFRSLGWVIRPGLKFGADYMLYNRGPVFSHAEFAVIIIPAYTHRYWNTPGGRGQRRAAEKDWWWFHCVNRVQSQVKKSLVLCYVDVPSPFEIDFSSVGRVLSAYSVREFVVRRWLPNRSRD
jgi:tRNA-splicing endonuclease subunit Sen2